MTFVIRMNESTPSTCRIYVFMLCRGDTTFFFLDEKRRKKNQKIQTSSAHSKTCHTIIITFVGEITTSHPFPNNIFTRLNSFGKCSSFVFLNLSKMCEFWYYKKWNRVNLDPSVFFTERNNSAYATKRSHCLNNVSC